MVVVFGSINVDLVTRVVRFPQPGETLSGDAFAIYPGGKGANQALAAARAGAVTALYGAVGDDAFGPTALKLLRAEGVALDGVARVSAPTGCATILVDARGENCIVVSTGANAHVDPEAVPDSALTPANTLLLQHEVPERANASLIERAKRKRTHIVLNAAPARPIPIALLRQIDALIANEMEAAALAASLGWPSEAAAFARTGAAFVPTLTVAVTLGSRGAIACSGRAGVLAEPRGINVVDTTGAGDMFVGALTAAFDRGTGLRDALVEAVAAGTLACSAPGAQTSFPCRAAIDAGLSFVTATTA